MGLNGFIMVYILFFLLISGQARSNHDVDNKNGATILPVNLRCEYLENPLGIENLNPRLSWNFKSKVRNQFQLAYHILVASSTEKLSANIGDLWDTGRVNSDQNIHISYAGIKLKSRMQLFWKVRVWDTNNYLSDWSEVANWEMGLIDPTDWQADWIGESEDKDPDSPKTGPAPYFRKEFFITNPVKSARTYVSGLGFYELYLNGKKVGNYVLSPSQTNYDRRNLRNLLYFYDDQSTTRVFYNIFDVLDNITFGQNAVGIILGNGWYNQRDRLEEGWMWYDTPRFILQIEIEYENGKCEIIKSDESWKVSTGPIVHNGIFTGEHYDARLEMDGWNRTGINDDKWKKAQIVRSPTGKLEAQLTPADKVVKTIYPISVSNPSHGIFTFDMGQMMSGWIRLQIKGDRGDSVSLRYIEEMGNDYGQRDIYVLKGGEIETFEPRFTWHAFRNVEISGVKSRLKFGDVEGTVVNTAVDTVGFFECSNGLFNKIYTNYIWTQLGNFHGSTSSDCPHRERLGYTGDGQVLVESSILNFDMTQFYKKWINDMDDARNKVTGYVPHTAPFGGGGGGPAWGSAFVTVPWFYYVYYGDVDILRQHYSGMKHWVEYLGTRTDEAGIVVREEPKGWCLGDWATPEKIEIPAPLVNTCYYYYVAKIMSRVAEILKYHQDANRFSELSDKIKVSLNNKYLNIREKKYWTSRQGADVFPLAFTMVPEKYISGVVESMIENILNNKGHLDTGILATPLMLEVLTDFGHEDLAFTIMNQRDFPSFGDYILGKGATTLWEYWDGKLSHSHPMFGSVIRWFYKGLAGINPDPLNPGFKHIIIKPTICGDLTYAKANYNSIHGNISSEWHLENNDLCLNVTIPVNTTATIHLPAINSELIRESAKIAHDNEGISFIKIEKGRAVYKIGSGDYEFISKNITELIKPVHVSTPLIFPRDSLFFKPETANIKIESASKGAKIYYTIDGSEPNRKSQQYTAPFQLMENTEVKARAFKAGFYPSFIKTEFIHFVDTGLNGLKYTVYEGKWDKKPDLNSINPVSSGRVFQFDVCDIPRREDHIAISFEGTIKIDFEGKYTFYSSANDGSVLYIDDTPVVDNAGYFGERVDRGVIHLKEGDHYIKVFYYENTGTESLDVLIEGPGLERQPIPPYKLFYRK